MQRIRTWPLADALFPYFAGNPLDRADTVRTDPDAAAALIGQMSSRLLAMEGLDPVIGEDGGLVWRSMAELPEDAEPLFLGMLEDKARFAAVTRDYDRGWEMSPGSWQAMGILSSADAALWATARSLISWHSRHRFCPACGGGTKPGKAGWMRQCEACATEHFPSVNPVVIMLAVDKAGDRALLGRQHRYPPRRYSALAGFMEPGETIEEAVRRELFEESGIQTSTVDYVVSQPWPFPHSLMIACIAEATSTKITIDPVEIEDALWVDRTDVIAAMAGDPEAPFIAPPPNAVAYTLLQHWLATSA